MGNEPVNILADALAFLVDCIGRLEAERRISASRSSWIEPLVMPPLSVEAP